MQRLSKSERGKSNKITLQGRNDIDINKTDESFRIFTYSGVDENNKSQTHEQSEDNLLTNTETEGQNNQKNDVNAVNQNVQLMDSRSKTISITSNSSGSSVEVIDLTNCSSVESADNSCDILHHAVQENISDDRGDKLKNNDTMGDVIVMDIPSDEHDIHSISDDSLDSLENNIRPNQANITHEHHQFTYDHQVSNAKQYTPNEANIAHDSHDITHGSHDITHDIHDITHVSRYITYDNTDITHDNSCRIYTNSNASNINAVTTFAPTYNAFTSCSTIDYDNFTDSQELMPPPLLIADYSTENDLHRLPSSSHDCHRSQSSYHSNHHDNSILSHEYSRSRPRSRGETSNVPCLKRKRRSSSRSTVVLSDEECEEDKKKLSQYLLRSSSKKLKRSEDWMISVGSRDSSCSTVLFSSSGSNVSTDSSL